MILNYRVLCYLFQYESMSGTVGMNSMRHTLEALGDVSTMNAADLKLRIEEMLRIKVITYNSLTIY